MAQLNTTQPPVYHIDSKRWDGKTLVLSVRECKDIGVLGDSSELSCHFDILISKAGRTYAQELVTAICKAIKGQHLVSFTAWGGWSSKRWFCSIEDHTLEYDESEALQWGDRFEDEIYEMTISGRSDEEIEDRITEHCFRQAL